MDLILLSPRTRCINHLLQQCDTVSLSSIQFFQSSLWLQRTLAWAWMMMTFWATSPQRSLWGRLPSHLLHPPMRVHPCHQGLNLPACQRKPLLQGQLRNQKPCPLQHLCKQLLPQLPGPLQAGRSQPSRQLPGRRPATACCPQLLQQLPWPQALRTGPPAGSTSW